MDAPLEAVPEDPRERDVSDRGEPYEPSLSKQASGDVRTVAKGGAVQLAGQISQRGLSFVFGLIVVRVLGTAPYGIYRTVTQGLAVLAQVGLAGFNYGAMRFISRARAESDPGGVRGAARVAIVATIVISAAVALLEILEAESVARIFADSKTDLDDYATLFRIGAAYVPAFALLQVWRYCTQAYKTMVPSVIAGNIIQPVARFILGCGVLIAGGGVFGLVNSLTISMAIAAVAAAIYFRRIMTTEERTAPASAPVGPMVRFSLPQGGSSLLGIQTLGLGLLLVSALDSNAQAGLFGIALTLQGPGNVFLGGVLNIWAPMVSDLHARGEMQRLESLYQTITRWVATFSFPVWATLILEPDMFVDLFTGGKGAGAEPIVALLAAGNFFYTGTGPTGYVLSMTGRPGVNFINSVAGVALYVVAGLWVVPRYGAVGMAAVDALVTGSLNLIRVLQTKILVGVQPFGRSILKPIGGTAAGAVVLLLWRLIPGDDVWLEVLGVCVAATTYVFVLKALGLDAEERYVWEQIRKRAVKKRRN